MWSSSSSSPSTTSSSADHLCDICYPISDSFLHFLPLFYLSSFIFGDKYQQQTLMCTNQMRILGSWMLSEQIKQVQVQQLIYINYIPVQPMDITRTNRSSSRTTYLPNINSSQNVSYAQRYQHMTKIANYNEMNEGMIWKEYEKLRVCLKELNEEVLHHMERKASLNLYAKETPVTASVEASLLLLEEERKSNESRLQIFLTEAAGLEQRVQHLTSKTQYLRDVNNQIETIQAKIKELTIENKDLKRKQKLVSKDLVAGPSFLEKLVIEEEALHYARKKYDKYDQVLKDAQSKIKDFNEKTAEYQSVFETRVSQYKQQEGYISQELNLEKFEQLQNTKLNLSKYETVYKRNYLMKLKELENLVHSITRHDQVIKETETNIKVMRSEIDQISAIFTNNKNGKRRSSVRIGSESGRKSMMVETVSLQEIEDKNEQNDKNKQQISKN